MGYEQYGRAYELIIGEVKITKLDISFSAERSVSEKPNTLALTVFNLNESHRQSMSQEKKPFVQLSVGYGENLGVVFSGTSRPAVSTYSRPDWVTEIEAGDGEPELASSRVNKSFAPGTDYQTVVLEVANSMGGIGLGNLEEMVKKASLHNGSKKFESGVTVAGAAKRELRRLLVSAGLEWSIQDGKFQVLEANKTLDTIAFVVSPKTGLIGSPTTGEDGSIRFVALLNPQIVPGRQVKIESKFCNGYYRADRCKYSGSTDDKDWYVEVEGRAI